jgi:hypothetical protein
MAPGVNVIASLSPSRSSHSVSTLIPNHNPYMVAMLNQPD